MVVTLEKMDEIIEYLTNVNYMGFYCDYDMVINKEDVTMHENTQKKLKKLKKELKNRAKDIKKSLMIQRSKDWEEAAVEAENDEVLEAIYSETTDELSQVKFALKRLESGDYGDCSECGNEINQKRLKVMPFTSFCIKCAQDLEC